MKSMMMIMKSMMMMVMVIDGGDDDGDDADDVVGHDTGEYIFYYYGLDSRSLDHKFISDTRDWFSDWLMLFTLKNVN